MNPLLRLVVVVASLALAACQKQPEKPAAPPAPKALTLDVVKENERSKNFLAVSKHLELGGPLYGYVDIEGDVAHLATQAQSAMGEIAKSSPELGMLQHVNLAEIAQMLGLTGVKAMGVSSVPDGTGYFRNRAFLYDKGERTGLMAALGGKPAPFRHVGLAPADTLMYAETELDVGEVYKTLKAVVAKVAGEPTSNQFEAMIQQASEKATFSILDLIYGFKGRSAVILAADPERTLRLPGRDGLVLPELSFLMCIEGIGQIIEPSFAQLPQLQRRDEGSVHIYELPQDILPGVRPALVVDGSTLYVTSTVAFLKRCREQQSGLGQTAEFKETLAHVGTEGNGLSYLSPKFFEQLRRVETLNAHLPPETLQTLRMVLASMPPSDRPLAMVRVHLDDGILFRAYYNRSFKQELAAVAVYNPVTVGVLAAMALPAFQKVRDSSQERAVINNLRQLSAAADQYFLENGKFTATYNDLVGPTKYVKAITPVAGENYRALRFEQGKPLTVRMRNGKAVTYNP
ncbi:MAG TPA: hypothetical protein VGE76_03240 [Opitutaceae bacterium]